MIIYNRQYVDNWNILLLYNFEFNNMYLLVNWNMLFTKIISDTLE